MFIPNQILFEKKSLDYQIGNNIYNYFKNKNTEIKIMNNNRISVHLDNTTPETKYISGKKTLLVGIKKISKFQTCKPSAHYQLPLVSGCTGKCEYCYLNTRLSEKPYIKVFVNINDILAKANNYINERNNLTIFEGSATSDPVPVEPYTNSLKNTIEFFANEDLGRFRFVTKYTDIDDLLNINHNNHTEIRFSINTDYIIKSYEHSTASFSKRIEASKKLMDSNYPIGFIIAPVFIYNNWKHDYENLINKIYNLIPKNYSHKIFFEVISHRYTITAKNKILEIFPKTTLPMNEDNRTFKYGQFGYGKYMYSKTDLQEIKKFFTEKISNLFSKESIKYII